MGLFRSAARLEAKEIAYRYCPPTRIADGLLWEAIQIEPLTSHAFYAQLLAGKTKPVEATASGAELRLGAAASVDA